MDRMASACDPCTLECEAPDTKLVPCEFVLCEADPPEPCDPDPLELWLLELDELPLLWEPPPEDALELWPPPPPLLAEEC